MSKRPTSKKGTAIWITILVVVLLLIALLVYLYFYFFNKTNYDNSQDNSIITNDKEPSNQPVLKGYENIAVFGVDSRQNQLDQSTRSDTIMIAAIDRSTNDVKLCSIYRDTYVKIPDDSYTKITHAYAKGGYSLALSTINTNFDLEVRKYITVNFYAVAKVVDLLGGITLDIQPEEVKWLNGYVRENNRVNGTNVSGISGPGKQTVNGTQALAYARIRYTSGGDFKRAERQRIVFDQIFQKAKSSSLPTLINIVNEMLPNVSTNLTSSEILSLARSILSVNLGASDGFPFEKTAATLNGVSYVFPLGLKENVIQLHEFLYGDTNYTPSSTVLEHDTYITSLGYGAPKDTTTQ